jgi:pimeloyl-ACP methyl ester carboxylesterase
MDRLGLAQADIVGCSIGGWIAAELATKSPERVRRLVLVCPEGVKVGPADRLDIPDIYAMPDEELERISYHDAAQMRLDTSRLSDDELAIRVRNRETTALLVWEPYMHNPKLRHRLHRVTAPTLFVRGESDGLVSADYVAAYARLLPNARVETIGEAGHSPHLEQPDAFARAVLQFLEANR